MPGRPSSGPTRTFNGAATAALTLGILGWAVALINHGQLDLYYEPISGLLTIVAPVLAVIFGHVGLRRSRHRTFGRRPAIAALVLGYLLIVLNGVVIVLAVA
jgi:hypothetical protein